MKKKIAIFANGITPSNLFATVKGIRSCFAYDQPDIFIFLSHSMSVLLKEDADGENSIYKLPDISAFDGVIVCSNNITSPEAVDYICSTAESLKKPLVTLGIGYKDYPVITIDNAGGMIELCEHLITEHGVKRAAFICGTKEHVDSNERLETVRTVFKKHNLSLCDDDVYYGNWQYMPVAECIDSIVKLKDTLPDAIICANDSMALIAISELALRGIRVPQDIIVTGYDGVDAARQFYPSVTSVKQDFEKVGEACVKGLFGSVHIRSKNIQLSSSARIAESCGCAGTGEQQMYRNMFCQDSFGKTLRNDLLTSSEKMIEDAIVHTDNIQQLKEALGQHYINNHVFEGDDFYIAVDAKLYTNKTARDCDVFSNDFEAKMTSVLALRNGKLIETGNIDRKNLIPYYDRIAEPHTYYFLPIHSGISSVGYVTFVDNPYCVKDRLMYQYVTSINQSFLRLRYSIRLSALNKNLTELYHKDAMTGLYNRFGFEDIAIPLFNKNTEEKKHTMICFLDVNYMKSINDTYGHQQGDNAIITVAEAIRTNERKNWISIRYGGDEFLIIAQCAGDEDAYSIKKNILSEIDYAVGLKKLPFHIGVSCGYVISDPESGKTLSEYIKAADEIMYEIKKEVHTKGVDRRRRRD